MEDKIYTDNAIVVSALTLLFTDIFGCISISQQFLFVMMLPFIISQYGKELIYKRAFSLLLIGICLNCASSYIFRSQDFFHTLVADMPFMHIFFFYVLYALSPSVDCIRKALVILILLYCAFYIVQVNLAKYGIILYSMSERAFDSVMNNTDGLFRLRIPGSALASLAIFLGIDSYLHTKKYIYLALSIVGLYVIVLMNFRSLLFVLPLFLFFYLYKVNKIKIESVVYILISIVILYALYLYFQPVKFAIDAMFERAEDNNFSNSDYIRNINLNYFLNVHFKSPLEYFFGSGMPYKASNIYANQMIELAQYHKIFWVDWGLLGLSWMLGVLPVMAMVYYCVIAYKKSNANTYFLSIWLLFLISCSITSKEFYREGNLVIQALVLYLIFKSNLNYEDRNTNI